VRVDPNYVTHLAVAVNQSSLAESNLTTQLSSGLRVTSLQVDPGAAASSAVLGSAIAKDASYVQAAAGKQSVLQATDSTLGEVVTQLTTAVSLAVQGSNGTLNASNLSSIAQQLTGIRDEVLALANSSYLGVHLFGGSQGSVVPFSVNTSTIPATAAYAGDNAVQSTETPTGQKIQVSLPGAAIFGDGNGGVFAALNQLIAKFSSGASGAGAVADTSALTDALSHVSSQRSVLNSSLARIRDTSNYFAQDQSQLTAQQTSLVSVDLTTVATQLKSAETQHQALLSLISALGSSNLFTYMK
jgi:flagellar hook-associated protein 3 FlgL